MNRAGPCLLCAALASAAAVSAARAQNVFTATAVGGSPTVTGGSDHLLDLVDDAVNTRGVFSGFSNTAATFSLSYGGVPNAIIISKNAANTQATLTLGPTGQTRTFTGVNQPDLERQIEEFLKGNGGSDLKDFFKAINRLSLVAVSDGNPNATTARSADFTFNRFGLGGDSIRTYRTDSDGYRSATGFQLDVGAIAGGYEAGDLSGGSATGTVAVNFFFGDQVGLSLGSWFNVQTVEDADIFRGGVSFGVPVRPVVMHDKTGVIWQITPSASLDLAASSDMAAGGSLYGIGVTNLVAWTPVEKFTLSIANQITFYGGGSLEFGDDSDHNGSDFNLDAGVSQAVLKNGVRGSFKFTDAWSMYGGVTFTQFLDDAAVNSWVSPEIGFRMVQPSGGGFSFALTGDFGDDYNAFGGRFMYKWAF